MALCGHDFTMANGKVCARQTTNVYAGLAWACRWECCATMRDDRWWPGTTWDHNHPVGCRGFIDMTTYNKRDLRAADMFAMILFGVGLVLVMVALFDSVGLGQAKGLEAKEFEGSSDLVCLWILAGLFTVVRNRTQLEGQTARQEQGS